MRARGPMIHPSCATLHGNASTPDPMTAVIACVVAVHTVPAGILGRLVKEKGYDVRLSCENPCFQKHTKVFNCFHSKMDHFLLTFCISYVSSIMLQKTFDRMVKLGDI